MKKHSVKIAGHPTSISLEDEFWEVIKRMAKEEGLSINAYVTEKEKDHPENLSGMLRLEVLKYYQRQVGELD